MNADSSNHPSFPYPIQSHGGDLYIKNSSVNPSYTVCALFYRHVQFICITKGTHYGPDMYYQTILLHQDKPDY